VAETASTVKTVHYQRQFLAPEESRYDRSSCFSYVYVDSDPHGIELEAELVIADGYSAAFHLDGTRDEEYDEHLAAVTRLMEQVIAYRQAYAEALALVRGQAITR